MEVKTYYKKVTRWVLHYIRTDLQLHFLWSFFLTMFAIFWLPFVWLGIIGTIIKEGLDLWSKGHWSWDDFWYGFGGVVFVAGVFAFGRITNEEVFTDGEK